MDSLVEEEFEWNYEEDKKWATFPLDVQYLIQEAREMEKKEVEVGKAWNFNKGVIKFQPGPGSPTRLSRSSLDPLSPASPRPSPHPGRHMESVLVLPGTIREVRCIRRASTAHLAKWAAYFKSAFQPFPTAENDQIDAAYLQGRRYVDIKDGAYRIDFGSFTQRNLSTGYVREVRRVLPAVESEPCGCFFPSPPCPVLGTLSIEVRAARPRPSYQSYFVAIRSSFAEDWEGAPSPSSVPFLDKMDNMVRFNDTKHSFEVCAFSVDFMASIEIYTRPMLMKPDYVGAYQFTVRDLLGLIFEKKTNKISGWIPLTAQKEKNVKIELDVDISFVPSSPHQALLEYLPHLGSILEYFDKDKDNNVTFKQDLRDSLQLPPFNQKAHFTITDIQDNILSMIDHLKRLNNPEHCVQLLAHKKCPMSSQIYIFRGSGGIPLLHYIENEMVPRVVISLMNSLLSAVKYIHSKYICHRDIKLENIFVLDGDVPSIQLANFHCSITFFPEENTLTGFVGNRAYMAPEIFNKGLYTPAVDFWACGVVLYTICLGHFPWIMDLGDEALEQQIVGNEPMWSKLVEFEEKDKGWVGVVDLAHQLMAWDPKAREQASNHPWIKN